MAEPDKWMPLLQRKTHTKRHGPAQMATQVPIPEILQQLFPRGLLPANAIQKTKMLNIIGPIHSPEQYFLVAFCELLTQPALSGLLLPLPP
jgi:hypothetical protein